MSGVQSAIALEALVSAAFILISSKLGDLFGRKLAYTVGLLGYAVGATAMVLADSLLPVIIFWAILGGLGASLLLPAMQSLIHGNFEGAAQRRVYALVGASAAIAAAVGPLVGGFITTVWSWRIGFAGEVVIIVIVLTGLGMVKDVKYTGERRIDVVGRRASRYSAWAASCWASWSGRKAGRPWRPSWRLASSRWHLLAWWLVRRKRRGDVPLIDPGLFSSKQFRLGISGQMMQQIALGGMMIALPIFLQMVLEYSALLAGLSLAPLSLSMFAIATLAGRRAGNRRPALIIRLGFALLVIGVALLIPLVPRIDSGWWMALPLAIAGSGLGLLVSQLNNYTLGPIEEERISEAAGVNSAGGSFGLSFGLALGGSLMLISLAFNFTALTNDSTVLPPDDKEQIAAVLEEDAEIMSTTALEAQLAGEPEAIQDEVIRINDEARSRALQVALLVPLLAGLIGLFNSFRMVGLPEVKPKADIEAYSMGG